MVPMSRTRWALWVHRVRCKGDYFRVYIYNFDILSIHSWAFVHKCTVTETQSDHNSYERDDDTWSQQVQEITYSVHPSKKCTVKKLYIHRCSYIYIYTLPLHVATIGGGRLCARAWLPNLSSYPPTLSLPCCPFLVAQRPIESVLKSKS